MHSRFGRAASLASSLLFAILLAAMNFKANKQTLRSPGASSSQLSDSNQNSERLQRLGPVQVLQQYIEFHGAESLLKRHQNFTTSDRKFAVAYLFPCAARAGNQFHNFFNNLLWAIITNRTLLLRFDSPTRQLCRDQPGLNLAPWLPLWDDWADAFLLSEDDVMSVPIDPGREVWDRAHAVVLFPQIPDILHENQTLFRGRWIDHPTNNVFGLTYVKNMGVGQRTLTHKLYRNGPDFLLGMLYRYCFLPVDIAQRHEAKTTAPRFSLALHSRHTVVGDTGEYIHEEIDCLGNLLPENRSLATCSVCIMSDRSLTIQMLSEWLLTNNCTPVVSHSQQQSDSLSVAHGGRGGIAEHGDRPATGFLQDLELCSQARRGTIGDSHRSSFLLLKELIEFERQTTGDRGNDVKKLLHCELTQREPSGYNYGPNTPLFQHWSKLKPFEPVETLQQYKNLHGVEAMVHQPEKRQYTVAFFSLDPCSIAANGTDQMYSFFNQLIWSVISNRTLLWVTPDDEKSRLRTSDETTCKEALKLASWIPSYDTMYARLGLPRPNDLSTSTPFGTTHADNSAVRVIDAWSSSAAADTTSKIMLLPLQSTKITKADLKASFGKQVLPESAKKLYRRGCSFLYGMLLDETIVFADSLRRGNPPGSVAHPDAFSVAFDAWYDQAKNNNTLHETKCFDEVLSTTKQIENKACSVYVLTNSESSLAHAQRWLSDCNCTIWMKNYTSSDFNNTFLQNFILASNARTAFIGPKSNLLRARIEYLRQQEIWRKGRVPPLIPELLTCFTNPFQAE